MANDKDRARRYAGDVCVLLNRKTGRDYDVKAYTVGKMKRVDIVDQDTQNVVLHYSTSKTWGVLCDIIHFACNTYLTIHNA